MEKKSNELGNLIRETRERLGLSQRQLAKATNTNNAEISRLEAGKRQKPNVLVLKSIAEVLNLSLVDLMKLAGYSDYEINFGRDASDNRSVRDYQLALKDYQRFYFDVLDDIDTRRNNALECKNICADLIDKIEHPEFYNEEISREEILKELKELFRLLRPNLEKFDKSKYPRYDAALLGKRNMLK